MNEIVKDVKKICEDARRRSNERVPYFVSDYEGIGILEEGIHEAREDFRRCIHLARNVKHRTFDELPQIAGVEAEALSKVAMTTACELILLSVMAQKFVDSKGRRNRFTQEHADMLAKICPEAKED